MTVNLNVFANPLKICGCKPVTGWFRDGYCRHDFNDYGKHTLCAVLTDSFLSYSSAQGNDLITPVPEFSFPGLKKGDHWCLCVERWNQAYLDGVAPLVDLNATNQSVLDLIPLQKLLEYAYD